MLMRSDKDKIIKGLKEDINNAHAFFVTNLIGIKSTDAVEIRKQIREAQGKLVITRNTLFAKAAMGTKAEKLFGELKGPHAVAFAFGEAPAVAKCLKEAGKTHEQVDLKAGFFGDEELTVAKIKMLADLPTREEMLGTLLATFNAPISALARVLNAIGEEKGKGSVESSKVEATVPEEVVADQTPTE